MKVKPRKSKVSGLPSPRQHPVAIKNLLVDLLVEAHARPPKQIILDLDATDDPLHGEQEGRSHRCPYVLPFDVAQLWPRT